jgi:VWFA-related protein
MVFDKQGRFVNGLKREDFDLRIDGKQRPVEFFERIAAGNGDEDAQISAARGSANSSRSSTGTVSVPLDRGRTIFFYVDDLHLKPSNFLRMRKLLLRYIDNSLGQNDMAAISSPSGSVGFLQQLTDNKTVLRAAVERLSPRGNANTDLERPTMSEYQALMVERRDKDVTDFYVDALMKEFNVPRETAEQMVESRARQILRLAGSATTNSLAGLEGLVRTTAKLPGRKLIIFLSDGFFLDDENSDSRDRLRKITSAAALNGVVIYSLDARGLVADLQDASTSGTFDPTGRLSRGSSGELIASQDAMNALASDTGGRALFNTNDLDTGLTTAIKETSVYYLLAWKPDPEIPNDKFRKISVNLVNHPGWTVRVRQGFFNSDAPTRGKKAKNPAETLAENAAPEASEVVLRENFREAFPNREIPVSTNVGYIDVAEKGMMLMVSMQINRDSIQFANDGTGGTGVKGLVDIRGTVYNDHGKAGATFTDRLSITSPSQEALDKSSRELLYSYQVFLPAGLYQVRVGVRDPATGKMGTAYDWVEVPSLTKQQLGLSTIFIGTRSAASSDLQPTGDVASTPAAVLRVDRKVRRNSVLRFILYVYNAQKSPTDALPDVGAQIQILRDQQPVVTTPSKRITTEGIPDLNRLPFAGDLSLEGLAPGQYIMQISIVDRLSKTSASQRIKLEIM